MAPSGGKTLETGLVARVAAGLRYALTGKQPGDWFGPGDPIPAVAQEQTTGRQLDFPAFVNTTITPRTGEPVDFPQLRALADSYDIVRLAIETRKDQMGKLRWTIQRADDGTQDQQAKDIAAFLRTPDREHDFLTWMRMIHEDLLAIDAPTVYIHRTKGGQPFALEPMDGATIKRILDPRGRTPMDGPAYQQILKGVPAADYTRDELIYAPRNVRTHKLFGFPATEQIITTVNIALRRQVQQLRYYTDGNIPPVLLSAPETWNADQIALLQRYWDTLAGDLATKQQMRLIPGGVKPMPLRNEPLFDMFDEWLARVVCYAFSLSPTAFTKQANRATAETAQEAALSEGLAPLMEWQVQFMNRLIRTAWGTDAYAFAWEEKQDIDPLVQAQIDQIYVQTGVRLPNEIRSDHDWEERPELDEKKLAPPPAPVPPGTPPGHGPDTPGTSPGTPAEASAADKVSKRAGARGRSVRPY